MTHSMRRACAAGALSFLVLAGGAGAASAEEPAAPDCSSQAAARDTARTSAVEARKAFTSLHGPIRQELAQQRAEARAEIRAARVELAKLRDAAKSTKDRKELKALREQMRTTAAEARKALKVISSKPAAIAELKAERRAAKADFETAKVALRAANAAYEDCTQPEVAPEPEPAPAP